MVRAVLTATSVPVDARACFTAEVTRGDHLPAQRTGPVFRIAELIVNGLHDRQQHIAADQVGQRQRGSSGDCNRASCPRRFPSRWHLPRPVAWAAEDNQLMNRDEILRNVEHWADGLLTGGCRRIADSNRWSRYRVLLAGAI